MNSNPVPVDLAEHFARTWQDRKRVSEAQAISAGLLRKAPPGLKGQIEQDVAQAVTHRLLMERWVLITTLGPIWTIAPSFRWNDDDSDTERPEERPWDPGTEPLDTIADASKLICRITGYAVKTFLETATWAQDDSVKGHS